MDNSNADIPYREYIVLSVYDNYIPAHIAMGRLSEEGIDGWLKDENTVTIDPILTNAVGGIKLMVLKQQALRAREILDQLAAAHRASQACPKCRNHNIELVTSPKKASNWIGALAGFFLGDFALGVDRVYHCFNCGHEFAEPMTVPAGDNGISS